MKSNLAFRRVLAYVLDFFLVSFLAALISMPFLNYNSIDNLSRNATEVLNEAASNEEDIDAYFSTTSSLYYKLNKSIGLTSFLQIVLCVLYFVVYQFYNNGQTIGKKLLKIRVVSNNQENLTIDNYIYRAFIVNSVLANILSFIFLLFFKEDLWFTSTFFVSSLNYAVLAVCLIMITLNKSGCGLHDIVSNTKVVYVGK